MVIFAVLEALSKALNDAFEAFANWIASAFEWLMSFFRSLGEWFSNLAVNFVNWFKGVFEKFLEFFVYLYDLSLLIFKNVLLYFLDLIATLVLPLIEDALNQSPELEVNLGALGGYLSKINYWIPLDYCFDIFVFFSGFIMLFFIIRVILKLIPTIG